MFVIIVIITIILIFLLIIIMNIQSSADPIPRNASIHNNSVSTTFRAFSQIRKETKTKYET